MLPGKGDFKDLALTLQEATVDAAGTPVAAAGLAVSAQARKSSTSNRPEKR